MLSQDTFRTGMAMLTTAFQNMRVTRENTKVWYNFFKDLSDEEFARGIDFIVKTNVKTPTVAEVREAALNVGKEKLTADEAWEKVINAVRSGNLRKDYFEDDNLSRVVSIYYTDLRDMTADNRSIIRAQFMKTFNNMTEREHKAELSGNPKVKALINEMFKPALKGEQ